MHLYQGMPGTVQRQRTCAVLIPRGRHGVLGVGYHQFKIISFSICRFEVWAIVGCVGPEILSKLNRFELDDRVRGMGLGP